MVPTSWLLCHLHSLAHEDLEVSSEPKKKNKHRNFSSRVSLTYRVKSAHKVKLTDKQLLQWMVPILLVMLIYLGTWTLSDTPTAEEIVDNEDLRFKQCVYNWWDHSLAIGKSHSFQKPPTSSIFSQEKFCSWLGGSAFATTFETPSPSSTRRD